MDTRTEKISAALDHAFACFCEHRDPDDLALVFDQTAPRLMVVAMHLVRDAHAAEDLVQTTFLEAIRNVDRFDRDRRVLPWLMTILTRRATDHRRRAQHGDAVEPSHALSPSAEVEQREVLDRVSEALAGLPAPYHEVLSLRFVHGLRAIEISRSLNRPAGTVHAQLHRGIEMLRKALPKSIAVPLAMIAVGSERGLAATRARVLAEVAGARSGMATALSMRRVLFAFAVGLGVCALWLGLSTDRPLVVQPGSAISSTPSLDRANTDLADASPTRESVAPSSAEISALKARRPLAIFKGRCVAAEDGTPIAGVKACLRATILNGQLARAYANRDPYDVDRVTGEDGCFYFEVPYRLGFAYSLVLVAPGRVRRGGYSDDMKTPASIDLGDVEMTAGASVTVDSSSAQGEKVGSLSILSVPEDMSQLLGGRGSERAPLGWIREGGELSTKYCSAIPPGTWTLKLSSSNFELLHPKQVTVRPGQESAHIDLRLRRLPRKPKVSISGLVLDESGIPIKRAGITAYQKKGRRGHVNSGRTDDTGAFTLESSLGPSASHLVIESPYEWAEALEPVAWPSEDVTLIARRPIPFRLRVVEAQTEEAVEDYALWIDSDHLDSQVRCADIHPEGRVESHDIQAGVRTIHVIPQRRDLAIQTLELSESPAGIEHVVRLKPTRPIQVTVRTHSGVPIPAAEVLLIDRIGHPLHDLSSVPHQDERKVFEHGWEFSHDGEAPLLRSKSRLDQDGQATLLAPAWDEGLTLIVRGTDTPVIHALSLSEYRAGSVELRALRGTRIIGRLSPPPQMPITMIATPPGDIYRGDLYERVNQDDLVARVDRDGRYEFTGLESGKWIVFATTNGDQRLGPPIHEVELGRGETKRLSSSGKDFGTAWLLGCAKIDDRPAPALDILLYRDTEEDEWRRGRGIINTWAKTGIHSDGSFEFSDIPAGSYYLVLRKQIGNELPSMFYCRQRFQLGVGERKQVTADFEFRRLWARWRKPEENKRYGHPMLSFFLHCRTHKNGWLSFAPWPGQPLQFSALDSGGKVILGEPFDLFDGPPERRFEFDLPDER